MPQSSLGAAIGTSRQPGEARGFFAREAPMAAQFAVSGAIQFGSKLLALLSGVLLARALGAEGLGVYSFTLSSVTLALLLCEFGMRSFLMREVSASLARKDWPYLRSLLNYGPLIVFATGAAVGGAGALLLQAFKGHVGGVALETYLLACAFLPCLALLRIMVTQLAGFGLPLQAQFYENLIYPGVVVGGVAVTFFALHGQLEPQVAMGFQTLAALATAAVVVAVMRRRRPPELTQGGPAVRPAWVRGALPFLVLEAALAVQAQVDTQIIGWLGDEATLGRYRIAVQLALLTTLGLTVLIQFSGPKLARLFATGDRSGLRAYYGRLQLLSLLSAGLVTLGLAAFGGWIIPTLFGAEYADAYLPLVILSLGFLGNAAFGPAGTLLLMTGDERLAARWFWLSLALNVATSPLLFHWFGAPGAAAASAAANTLNHLLCWLTARRRALRAQDAA
jgi:O-antigen/teichoic acid export membrane protein